MKKSHNKRGSHKIVKLESLKQINLNAAGLDIADEEIWAAIPEGRQDSSVRQFATFTTDLYSLADWLEQSQVNTVATPAPTAGTVWSPPVSTGSLSMMSWKHVDSRCTW